MKNKLKERFDMEFNFKVEDKFVWQEGRCLISSYLNDIYQLSYDKDRGVYYIETFYSETGDYEPFEGNDDGRFSYEDICYELSVAYGVVKKLW